MVMKYYSEYNLPLRKEKNKYVINREEFYLWLEEMQRIKEEQERQQKIIAVISIAISLIMLLYVIFKMM